MTFITEFAPPRAPDDRRDQVSIVMAHDKPAYVSQAEDDTTTAVRAAMARAVLEPTNTGAQPS